MYTVDTALDSLKKYDIRESDLLVWEKALDLDIPVDEYGRKQYSPHHINLFKNIKKHLALGRTIDEIREIINLPPLMQSRPQVKPTPGKGQPQAMASRPQTQKPQQTAPIVQSASPMAAGTPQNIPAQTPQPQQVMPTQPKAAMAQPVAAIQQPQTAPEKSAYASAPKRPAVRPASAGNTNQGAANVINLVQRLTREKDQLYKKLLETEKLNSHLYSANSLFHKKVREMSQHIRQLRDNMDENEKFKLLDDKARLHKQLIDAERLAQQKQEEMQLQLQKNELLKEELQQQERKIQALTPAFDPAKFRGDWVETGKLVEVIYDNFGINIEPERVRVFRISDIPTRLYGAMAIINTSYQYETNNLWKRDETLTVSYLDEQTLDGELTAEYVLDGVPVAKALYRITCKRNQ